MSVGGRQKPAFQFSCDFGGRKSTCSKAIATPRPAAGGGAPSARLTLTERLVEARLSAGHHLASQGDSAS